MQIINEIASGVVITVDNGIAAIDEIQAAKEKGLSILIIDHHLASDSGILPAADVIVNPNAVPGSDFSGYCGAGLAYMLARKTKRGSEKLLNCLSSLAAIGTVADVAPLISANRKIVVDGLKNINADNVPSGLSELLYLLNVEVVTEEDIGFKIGPVINAAGRMHDCGAIMPFELMAYDDHDSTLAQTLVDINTQRKEAVKNSINYADLIIAEDCLFGDVPLVLYTLSSDTNIFKEGVVGIIAGRLAEQHKVPVIVLTESDEPGVLKGSGRSYGNIHLKELLDEASDLLIKHGGHAGAVGLSIDVANINELRIRLKEAYDAKYGDEPIEESDTVYYDMEMTVDNIGSTLKELKRFAPFGEGNPKVVFKVNDFRLLPRMGQFYKRLGDGSTIKMNGKNCTAIGFGIADKYQEMGEPMVINLISTLSENVYYGKSTAQLEILDFADIDSKPASALANLLAEKMKKF